MKRPDVAAEGDDVGGVADELERGRPVEAVHDDGEGAVGVAPDERAGVRLGRIALDGAGPDALREAEECATAADARPTSGPKMGFTTPPACGLDTSTVTTSPPRPTTYAVFPMNSSEVGRSRPVSTTVKVPSAFTRTSDPVSGSAG